MMLEETPRNTKTILKALRGYVEQVLQGPLEFSQPVETVRLPPFLAQRYTLIAGHILGHPCILMLAAVAESDTPATIAKHRDAVQRHFPDSSIIFVAERLSTHNRHRLIAHHVAFIVPGNQMFLPQLAIDLREHFRKAQDMPGDSLSPASQFLVVAALLGKIDESTPTELAARFNYSVMSMSRAIAELEALQLVEVVQAGRSRRFHFLFSQQDLWHKSREHLRSPVRKRRRVLRPHHDMDIPLAGQSALAERSNLSDPRIETRAIAAAEWKGFAQLHQIERNGHWEQPEIDIETWSYDPRLLGDERCVDPISLWLSLADTADERIAAAKDALLQEAGL